MSGYTTEQIDELKKDAIKAFEKWSYAFAHPEATTTVTVWGYLPGYTFPENHTEAVYSGDGSMWKYWKVTYLKEGLPDIDVIIKETLERGAMAIKVVCTKNFLLPLGILMWSGCYLWDKRLGNIRDITLGEYKGYLIRGCEIDSLDADIEAAITAYLAT